MFGRSLRTLSPHAVRVHQIKTAAASAESLSYCKGLFLGVNNERRCFPFPVPSSDERQLISELVVPIKRYMANEVDSKAMDETKEIPLNVFSAFREIGLFGLQIPKEFDGLGLSNTGYARVCEEVSVDA